MNWWRFVVAGEIRKILAYRTDFWVTFLGQTFIQLIIARSLWANIFASSGNKVMEGYTLPMMTLYYLIVPIGMKVLWGENMGFLSREIYDGTFNRYLVYPLSFFQYKTFTYLTYSVFYVLQLILIYLLYQVFFGTGLNADMLMSLLMGSFVFVLSGFTTMNLSLSVELLALWAENIWSLSVMLRFFTHFLGGALIPIAFFPDWLGTFLKYTPFPYLMSLPVRTIMGLTTTEEIVTGSFILVGWGLLVRLFSIALWKKGQFKYSGVGI